MTSRWAHRAALGLLGLLVVGCGRAPARVDVDLDVEPPASWSAGAETHATGTTPEGPGATSTADTTNTGVTTHWWSTFGSVQLDSLILEAVAHNHELRAAVARIDGAHAQARIAGADGLPSLSAGFAASRERRSLIGIPLPPGIEPTSTTKRFGVSLNSAWELDLWGRIRSATSAARAEFQATWADAHGVQASLAAQTAKVYFALIEAQHQVALAETTVASYEASVSRVRDRYTRGLRPSLDVRLAVSNLAAAEALLAERRARRDQTVRQLETLLGRYPHGALDATATLPEVPPAPSAGLPSELLARRPDLVAAERRLAAAGARVRESRRALLPRLSLAASTGTTAESLGDVLNGDFFIWNLVGNLTQPLFQGGRLRAGVQLANATAAQALESYAAMLLRAYGEVEGTLARERFLEAQERAQAQAAQQSAAAERLAEDRYRNGLEDFITLLESQRRALEAQSRHLTVQRQRLDARVDLHLALGGGFELTGTDSGHVRLEDQTSTLGSNAQP